MKKAVSIIMIFAVLFALAGCASSGGSTEAASPAETSASSSSAADTPGDTQAPEAGADDNDTSENSALVVYFSRTGEQYEVGVIDKGNTAIVADMIVEQTGADSFEILPEEDNYPMTYKELTDYAKQEQNDNARPGIASTVEGFDGYDTIYLGYPIWWGDLPMICYTFLESYDFSGKTVIPFCTHEGSGNAGTQAKIQSAIPDAQVKEVLAIKGSDAQNSQDSVRTAVTDWLNGME